MTQDAGFAAIGERRGYLTVEGDYYRRAFDLLWKADPLQLFMDGISELIDLNFYCPAPKPQWVQPGTKHPA
nr:hypothetical protein [Rhizobium ruizarguesonis]